MSVETAHVRRYLLDGLCASLHEPIDENVSDFVSRIKDKRANQNIGACGIIGPGRRRCTCEEQGGMVMAPEGHDRNPMTVRHGHEDAAMEDFARSAC